MTAFEEMGVLPEIGKAVEAMDWSLPTDVQAEAIPLILGGGDVLMAAETGSGKTGAFCLPIIQIVYETLRDIKEGKIGSFKGAKVTTSWKLNVFDRGNEIAIDPSGTLVQSRNPGKWFGTRCMKGVKLSGKYCYEATVTDEGLCRFGVSTNDATLDVGTDNQSWGYGGTGKKSHRKQFDDYGEPYQYKDVMACLLDLDNCTVAFAKNGVIFPTAFQLPRQVVQAGTAFFPSIVLKNAEMKFNFGEEPMKHSYPGFMPFQDAATKQTAETTHLGSGASQSSGRSSGAGPQPKSPYAIIIEPSRELAQQTLDQVTKFKQFLPDDPPVRECLLIGGADPRQQQAQLNAGVEIVVATPGRLEDLIRNDGLLLDRCRYFVLDEADGLLSAGYTDLINRIHGRLPKLTPDGRRLQTIVCSATLHSFDVRKLADRLMHYPVWIDLKGQDSVPETVHHVVCRVDPRVDVSWRSLLAARPSVDRIATDGVHDNDRLQPTAPPSKETLSEAVKILKAKYTVEALRKHDVDRALVFCRTKIDCDHMEEYLRRVDATRFSCVVLHGDRKPHERKANLERFRRAEVRLLICTDVAARGIDIGGLPFVINVTLPDEKQSYVHRIGRVGRADRMGLAISLVSDVPEKVWYHSNCPDRGRSCRNTTLTSAGGCCIWYDEPRYLADVEEHLGVTIDAVTQAFDIPRNEFDGKVVYGEKRRGDGNAYRGHVDMLAGAVAELAALEQNAQLSYLSLVHRA